MEVAVMEKTYTAEQYLEEERNSLREDGGKHQFFKNKRILMAGGTKKHDRIVSNIHLILGNIIGDGENFELYTADMRLSSVSKFKEYFYSDGAVVQGKPQFADHYLDILTNPALIVEVLSKSTELFDRTDKFESYRELESLNEYILVSQNQPYVEQFYKNSAGEWVVGLKLKSLDAVLTLKNLPFQLPLNKIYQRVNFEEKEEDVSG
jgi:Uma2 family endonuclease